MRSRPKESQLAVRSGTDQLAGIRSVSYTKRISRDVAACVVQDTLGISESGMKHAMTVNDDVSAATQQERRPAQSRPNVAGNNKSKILYPRNRPTKFSMGFSV